MIADVLQRYYPDWEPPPDKKTWNPCLCPDHEDSRPSAAVSYVYDAVKCLACGFSGTPESIIMKKEGIGYRAALKRASEIVVQGGGEVRRKPSGKPSRKVFGGPGNSQLPVSQGQFRIR